MPPVEDVFARLRYMREGNRNNDVANDSKEDSKGLELLNHYFFGFLLFILYLYKYIYTLFNIFCFLFFFKFFFFVFLFTLHQAIAGSQDWRTYLEVPRESCLSHTLQEIR